MDQISGSRSWSSAPSVGFTPNNGNGGLTYDVVIPNSGSGSAVQLDIDATVESLTFSGRGISGSNTLTVNKSAVLGGSADLRATLYIGESANLTLNGLSVTGGALQLAGSGTLSGSVQFYNSGSFDILQTGALSVSGSRSLSSLSSAGLLEIPSGQLMTLGTFTNSATGVLRVAGMLSMTGSFTSDGLVETVSGSSFSVGNWGARFSGAVHLPGTFGTGLVVRGGTIFRDVNVSGGRTLSIGLGEVEFDRASVGAPVEFNGFSQTMKITGDSSFDGTVTSLSRTTISGSGTATFADLNWSGGTIAGNVSIPVGGNIRTGSTRVGLSGSLKINGTGMVYGSNSTITFAGGTPRFEIAAGAVFNVNTGLTFDRASSSFNANATLLNAGLISQSTNATVSFSSYPGTLSQWTFLNSGTVRVNSQFTIAGVDFRNTGLFDVRKVGMSIVPVGGTIAGSFILAAGTGVGFGGTNCTIGAISMTNAGNVAFFGNGTRFVAPLTVPGSVSFAYDGNLILDAPVSLPDTATIDRSTIQGAFALTANNLTFKSGTIRTTLTIPSGGTATLSVSSSSRHLAGGTFILAGTGSWSGGKLYTTDAANPATFDIRSGAFLSISGTTAAALNLASNTSATGLFRNSATVELAQGAAFSVSGGWTFDNSGTVRLLSGASIAFGGAGLLNSGVIDLAPGSSAALGRAANPIAIAEVRNQIHSGFNGGAWSGTGITAVALTGDTTSSLVCVAASDLLGLSGTSTATWQRQTVDATSVLVRYALNGDANLDGAVDKTDLDRIAPAFASPGTWLTGDFDSSGQFDFDDLLLLARNFSAAVPPAGTYDPAFESQLNFALAQVPEPSTLALLSLAGSLTILRRTRSRRPPVA